jgi:hypothetical protein
MKFHDLEKLGRVQLSRHFCMRQFLYSEIATVHGLRNIPDNPELAISAGKRLCEYILEPIVEMFGPIIVRSGYRSATLNDFGFRNRLRCASNQKNRAYQFWDALDDKGHMGAAACIVIPSAVERCRHPDGLHELAHALHDTLPYHRMTFFSSPATLNIGWHEAPRREVYSYRPRQHWIIKQDLFGNVSVKAAQASKFVSDLDTCITL